MTVRRLTFSALACAALILGTALLFSMPLERAAVLAPVIVASAGALAFVVVLWTRIAITSLWGTRHPRRIVAAGALALVLLVVVSFFVDLPARQ
jgi:uncharacterized PurR-regulated membrane protein YhhQ (DUF165 family)